MNGVHASNPSEAGVDSHSVNGNINGHQSHDAQEAPDRNCSLRIIIVGAGIGGSTAAIALRRQGHKVTLLEQSRFAQELGAAVHLAPNANGVLRRLGVRPEEFGANDMGAYTEYNADGSHVRTVPSFPQMWQHPWQLAHRVRLHDTLKKLATGKDGPGEPAQLLTSTRVVSINSAEGIVKTADGTEHKGDVIVGADGVHSVSRLSVPGWNGRTPFDSGKSAFRFMIPRSAAVDDPTTRKFCEKPGGLVITIGEDRRIVLYPTNNNEELNFVCIHPSSETKASGDWNNETSVEKLVEVFQHFDAPSRALLAKANPATLKVWNLLDMEKLPTFVHERMALVGDAAHPFLPHQGQGAGMAIEDAISLAVMLSDVKSSAEIPERLKLYNEARYERAHNIQTFSRLIGQDEKDRSERPDMVKYTAYNFGHDEWDASSQRLREWRWAKTPSFWRQPIAFGPMPGPRQDHTGVRRNGDHSTAVTASIKFKTSRTVLQNLFPPGRKGLSFRSPSTVAYASITVTTLDKMDWLGGGGYTFWTLWVHGVQYTKKDGSVLTGSYLPLLFENLTDPILSGREELGMPKLFSDIEVQRSSDSSEYSITTSWRGAAWGKFTLTGLKETTPGTAQPAPPSASNGGGAPPAGPPGAPSAAAIEAAIEAADAATQIIYRSMPTVGMAQRPHAAEEFFACVHTAEEQPKPQVLRSFETTNASVAIDGSLGWKQLPTLCHIVQRLAEIPVYEVVSAKVTETRGVSDLASCRRIE